MEYALYRLDWTKLAFENHWPIDPKLYPPTFNYPNFYVISYFVQCVQDYSSAVNYDILYSKAAHK